MTRKKKQKACSRKHRNILCGAERLRAHDALPEDQMSVSSPYQVSHNCLTISRPVPALIQLSNYLQASDALFWLPWTPAHTSYITHIASTHRQTR